MNFTEQDIKAFKAYEKVRAGGRYNMFDPNARRLTGLSQNDYTFVMVNFDALKKAAMKVEA